jgi:hypothetical protein
VWERVQPTVVVYLDGQMHFETGLQRYMDDHSFRSCTSFPVQGTLVTIFRSDCSLYSNAH